MQTVDIVPQKMVDTNEKEADISKNYTFVAFLSIPFVLCFVF